MISLIHSQYDVPKNLLPERKHVDKGPTTTVTVRMPESMKEKLDRIVGGTSWSRTDIIVTLINNYIEECGLKDQED